MAADGEQSQCSLGLDSVEVEPPNQASPNPPQDPGDAIAAANSRRMSSSRFAIGSITYYDASPLEVLVGLKLGTLNSTDSKGDFTSTVVAYEMVYIELTGNCEFVLTEPALEDPFAEANAEDSSAGAGTKDYVHVRIQQRNGRKSLTTVQGLKKEYSYNKILKDLKKEFCCNGTVVQDPELGQVIQLQGDQRKNVATFLVQAGIVKKESIKIHGF
ncbi:hypothetical protein C2845_PM07G26590 [Panicum miliaceum]|uniref:Protein translation factor SUI1 homolog n=1 Tax=Panicum miliaceum TaxID=4540 RepID=A0A3L6SR93_PANMI|nr:hypothetical protein C2845_PM07G26590 [Panicum miliaceum]